MKLLLVHPKVKRVSAENSIYIFNRELRAYYLNFCVTPEKNLVELLT